MKYGLKLTQRYTGKIGKEISSVCLSRDVYVLEEALVRMAREILHYSLAAKALEEEAFNNDASVHASIRKSREFASFIINEFEG